MASLNNGHEDGFDDGPQTRGSGTSSLRASEPGAHQARQNSAELNSAVSRVCSLRLLEATRRLAHARHADYKSAIQQIEILRYDLGLDAALRPNYLADLVLAIASVKVLAVSDMPVRCSLTHLIPALHAPSRFGAGAVRGRMLSSASL